MKSTEQDRSGWYGGISAFLAVSPLCLEVVERILCESQILDGQQKHCASVIVARTVRSQDLVKYVCARIKNRNRKV